MNAIALAYMTTLREMAKTKAGPERGRVWHAECQISACHNEE